MMGTKENNEDLNLLDAYKREDLATQTSFSKMEQDHERVNNKKTETVVVNNTVVQPTGYRFVKALMLVMVVLIFYLLLCVINLQQRVDHLEKAQNNNNSITNSTIHSLQ